MSYVSATFAVFPYPRRIVYEALSDLSRSSLWDVSIVSISPLEVMREGLRFKVSSYICGIRNNSIVAVERMVKDELIELSSRTGLFSYRVLYNFVENSSNETEVICTLRFEFSGFIFNAPRRVIESMAKMRCQRDLVNLRSYIIRSTPEASAAKTSQSPPLP